MRRAIVLGGGVAGLATAVSLASHGVGVTVLEARRRLGGRASSVPDGASGGAIDNGPHAMMGCYRSALAFLERIGATRDLRRQRSLRVDLVDPHLGAGSLACPRLPSPLHVAAGLLGFPLLTRGEKLRALVAGLRLLALRNARSAELRGLTVAEVLTRLGQSPDACRRFWDPVAVATCNELPERAAAAPFAEVVALAFFGSRADSEFVFSRVGLSELYAEPARRFIERSGGRVVTGAVVESLERRGERIVAARLRDGTSVAGDGFVSALPPGPLAAVLRDEPAAAALRRSCAGFSGAPIVSTHLWLDRPVLSSDFVGLVDATAQWVFDVDRLWRGARAAAPSHLAAVISAAHDVATWPAERIEAAVLDDLRRLLPAARTAGLIRAVTIKERHATISVTPESDGLRPTTATPLVNLFLAGDWIATGLPPTIESAARSAEWAAAACRAHLALEERAAA